MDNALTQFVSAVRPYAQQLDPETVDYLVQTFRMGQRNIAFTSLVSCLVELGYNEDQLLQGPLAQTAQVLGIDTTTPLPAPDPSAIRRLSEAERPDPFADIVNYLQNTPAPVVPGEEAAASPEAQQTVQIAQTVNPVAPPETAMQQQPSQIIQPSVAPAAQPNEEGVLHIH